MITVDMSQMRTNAVENVIMPPPPAGEIQMFVIQLDQAVSSLEVHCGDLVSRITPIVCISETSEAKAISSGPTAARTKLGGALAQLVSRVEELRGKIAKVNAGVEL